MTQHVVRPIFSQNTYTKDTECCALQQRHLCLITNTRAFQPHKGKNTSYKKQSQLIWQHLTCPFYPQTKQSHLISHFWTFTCLLTYRQNNLTWSDKMSLAFPFAGLSCCPPEPRAPWTHDTKTQHVVRPIWTHTTAQRHSMLLDLSEHTPQHKDTTCC